jgi:hypothetical protein
VDLWCELILLFLFATIVEIYRSATDQRLPALKRELEDKYLLDEPYSQTLFTMLFLRNSFHPYQFRAPDRKMIRDCNPGMTRAGYRSFSAPLLILRARLGTSLINQRGTPAVGIYGKTRHDRMPLAFLDCCFLRGLLCFSKPDTSGFKCNVIILS